MRIYKKEGDTIKILCLPEEEVDKGDYLLIEEPDKGRALLAQVIDVQFANVPGVLEELIRDSVVNYLSYGEDVDPMDLGSHLAYIEDARLITCKIRCGLVKGRRSDRMYWLPSRSRSNVRKISFSELLRMVGIGGDLPISLGRALDGSEIYIDARSLDGSLTIITGKKGTGKSHLSKLLVLSLVDYGATVVVLDLNGEYTRLGYNRDGEPNRHHDRILVLKPGDNFKTTLARAGLYVMMNIMIHALSLPGTSAREFKRIWYYLRSKDMLTMSDLENIIRSWRCNENVRDALFSRYYALASSGFFTDEPGDAMDLEDALLAFEGGGAVVINLRDLSVVDRRVVVEYVLGKLTQLLSKWVLKAVFLFAEEAHLYLRETYWEDVVTRMRHLGIFTTFITNQPDTIRDNIYRQADNIFLFNFTNQKDLEMVARASRVDAETVKAIARELPPGYCLIIGRAVKDAPIIVKVRELDVETMGRTRYFFERGEGTPDKLMQDLALPT